MNEEPLPPLQTIKPELLKGEVIPFLGAGASQVYKRDPGSEPWDPNGLGRYLPTGSELALYLAKKSGFPEPNPRLDTAAQYYSLTNGDGLFIKDLHQIFSANSEGTSLHSFLAEEVVAPLLIVTTNYDSLIERAFDKANRPYDVVIHTTSLQSETISVPPRKGDPPRPRKDNPSILLCRHGDKETSRVDPNDLLHLLDLKRVTVIYKMHGAVDQQRLERDQYVITEDHYTDFLERLTDGTAIPKIFSERFQTLPFLFLGYGLNDWDFRVVLNRI